MSELATDVCVIGGGPAGACAALRLAQLGHRVCVIERANGAQQAAECVAPSIAPLLESLGVLAQIERAGFLRSECTRVLWSGKGEAAREGRTLIVARTRFDRILLDAAAQAGVVVLSRAHARRPVRTPSGWAVRVDTDAGPRKLNANFLVDAAGRRAAGSRAGASSVALCGRWRMTRRLDAPEMRVEAGARAWFWGAPQADGSYAALVFVDAQDCAGLSAGARESLYRSLLGSSVLLGDCLSGTLAGRIVVRDATCRVDAEPVTAQSIKVGDAAFAMDPLSSQGIQAAVRSGAQAAVVVHTLLSGGDTVAAIEFYRNAQRANFERHRRVATGLYASQALHESPFWRERAEGFTAVQPPRTISVALTPETHLRLSPDARLDELPAIDGKVVRRRTALLHPALEQPVTWLGGVPLGPALSSIGTGRQVAAILADWSHTMPAATARNMLVWLAERGVLDSA